MKFRKGFEKGEEERKFWWEPPTMAGQVPFLPPDFEPRGRMILVEGETDTMALWQAIPASLRGKVAVVGLSGTDAWKPHYAEELFGPAGRVFVVFDREDPYQAKDAYESVERGWRKIHTDLGRKARRVVLPQGINDVAEFFQRYDWPAFEALLKAAVEPFTHYPRLDFTQPVPPTDWLVEDLIEFGAVTVIAGDSGTGKSFLTQALAKAYAAGEEAFLGRKLTLGRGTVLYVDEENNGALVRQRMRALGLREPHYPNLEYVSEAGVDIFNEPELLLREAVDRELALIVIDSQGATSIGAEENSSDDMTKLYRRGLAQLARQTGAAVVVLHHTPKESQGMPRGSSAIKSQADQVLSVVPVKDPNGAFIEGRFNLFASKQRRLMSALTVEIVGDMEEDGVVEVRPVEEVF